MTSSNMFVGGGTMGLIGWADAPNSIEPKSDDPQTQAPIRPAPVESEPVEPEPVETPECAAPDELVESGEMPDDVSADSIDSFGSFEEPETADTMSYEDDGAHDERIIDPESFDGELLKAIRNLKLAGNPDDDKYDISKFELHEIKFLFEHSERIGSVDYFAAVREVFGVKHRILDERVDIDSIDSPNLDELMAFVEGKYERSFGGENS